MTTAESIWVLYFTDKEPMVCTSKGEAETVIKGDPSRVLSLRRYNHMETLRPEVTWKEVAEE